MGLPSTSRVGASNGATLNWPARARNASSSWLRRSAGDGGKRRTTLVRSLAQQRSLRAPRALRAAARAGWEHRWWGQLGCALPRALASTLLGGRWRAPVQLTGDEQTPLGWVQELAEAEQPSCCPCVPDAHERGIGRHGRVKLRAAGNRKISAVRPDGPEAALLRARRRLAGSATWCSTMGTRGSHAAKSGSRVV